MASRFGTPTSKLYAPRLIKAPFAAIPGAYERNFLEAEIERQRGKGVPEPYLVGQARESLRDTKTRGRRYGAGLGIAGLLLGGPVGALAGWTLGRGGVYIGKSTSYARRREKTSIEDMGLRPVQPGSGETQDAKATPISRYQQGQQLDRAA